ncbi:MAG TPA: SDR family oxidoreductase [Thermoanaerobaculia bacterium]
MTDIAIVTGASGGIGGAIARMIHSRSGGDLRIALHCHRNRPEAEKLRDAIPSSFVVEADLSLPSGRAHLLREVLREGAPYVLVNNAGLDRPHEPALDLREDSFEVLVALNLEAPLFLMRDFGKEMARAGSGVIVNVSSVLARSAVTGSAVYRATKAALEELTRQFARELGPRNVRVNAVAPGFIDTPMTSGLEEDRRDRMRREIALGEFGAPDAVASAVCHLIENEYINGVVLPVDGGIRL